jgi:hypothetical protein
MPVVSKIATMRTPLILFIASVVGLSSCKKDEGTPAASGNLIFKFKFDSTQARLNNIGEVSSIPAGNAAQSPVFNTMSAHYIELAPGALTPLGKGAILYKAPETTDGGDNAIDFERSSFAGNDEVFYSIPLKDIAPGRYEWLRISLAYQNADVSFEIDTTINSIPFHQTLKGTLAGFIGFNTYIKTFRVNTQTIPVNANKKQGFWGFETALNVGGVNYPFTSSGQAPEGATTVVNPLFATSPIPAGSCVVTAAFAPGALEITGNETKDIIVETSFSTNKSFEWREVIFDGKWQPTKGEAVVDMGIRGMIPTIK